MGIGSSKPRRQPVAKRLSSQDQAILDLKIQRDKLRLYQKRIELMIQCEISAAKDYIANGQNSKALLVLARKKYQTTLLNQTEEQIFTIEKMASTIEYSQVEARVLEGIQTGNKALHSLQLEISLDKVQDVLNDTKDYIYYQNEISDLLSQQNSTVDKELHEELDNLCSLEVPAFPVPPNVNPQAVQESKLEHQPLQIPEIVKAHKQVIYED